MDPNEKLVSHAKYIRPQQTLTYPIHYENIGNAEAQDVFITDILDPNLDTSKLQLLTPGATFEAATRTVKWSLYGRNLPPKGTDNVLLSIKPKPNLPSGTMIRNKATIQFEIFAPLTTNETVNIIDTTVPVCKVNTLPTNMTTTSIPLAWTGTDAIGEVATYSVFVSVNSGPFSPIMQGTTNTSTTSVGQVGNTYSFYCTAIDTAGNPELQLPTAEATTAIVPLTPACTAGLSAPAVSIGGDGSKGTVTLTLSGSNCAWLAVSNASWAQVYPLSGTSGQSVEYTVYPNFSTSIRTAVLSIGGKPFVITQPPSGRTRTERFVDLVYFNFLGRLPSVPERSLQVNDGLKPPATWADLVMSFYSQPEFNLGGRFIAGLYVGLLARDAEFSGWLFQRNALVTGGITQLQLVANFLNSDEFKLKYPNFTDVDFVRLLYRNILGREGTDGEVNPQVVALPSVGRAGMANRFLNSGEFRTRNDLRLSAFLLYATLLLRGATASELAFREEQLRSDVAVKMLVEQFIGTDEFLSLLN